MKDNGVVRWWRVALGQVGVCESILLLSAGMQYSVDILVDLATCIYVSFIHPEYAHTYIHVYSNIKGDTLHK